MAKSQSISDQALNLLTVEDFERLIVKIVHKVEFKQHDR